MDQPNSALGDLLLIERTLSLALRLPMYVPASFDDDFAQNRKQLGSAYGELAEVVESRIGDFNRLVSRYLPRAHSDLDPRLFAFHLST
jgi:hypothetical protein